MRSYVQLIYSLVALATSVVPFSALANGDGTVAVSVSGYGPTPQEARDDAVRQALQKTMQQLIVVDRRIENDEVTQDRLLSTMNGYVENFEEVRTIRDADQFRVDARVTISASKIRNFLVTTNTRGGSVDGLSMFEELSREDAQQRAHKQILSRFFRGFPGQVIVAKAISASPSTLRSGYFDIGYTLQVDEQWLSSLRETLATIATRIVSYGPKNTVHQGPVSNFLAAYGARNTTTVIEIPYHSEPSLQRPVTREVCIEFPIRWTGGIVANYIYNGDIKECYSLPTAGAPIFYSREAEAIRTGGHLAFRFIDGRGRSTHRAADQSCMVASIGALPYYDRYGPFTISTVPTKEVVRVPVSAVSMENAKHVAMVVAAIAVSPMRDGTLVPVADVSDLESYFSGGRDICDDVDKAVDGMITARRTAK